MAHWKPLAELEDLFEDVHWIPQFKNGWDLAADVSEDNSFVYVSFHVPGIDPEQIDISVKDKVLCVSGTRKEVEEEKGRHYYHKEIKRGSFERHIVLPIAVDQATASAEFKDGVLHIKFPKKKEAASHKIKIERK